MLSIVIVVVSSAITLGLVAWFFAGQNPAQGEGGRIVPLDTDSDRFYHPLDRPAGPDVEGTTAD